MIGEPRSWSALYRGVMTGIGGVFTVLAFPDITLTDLVSICFVVVLATVSYQFWGIRNKYFLPLLVIPLVSFSYVFLSPSAFILCSWAGMFQSWRAKEDRSQPLQAYLIGRWICITVVLNFSLGQLIPQLPSFIAHARILEAVCFTLIYNFMRKSHAHDGVMCITKPSCNCEEDSKLLWITVVLGTISANVADALVQQQWFLAGALILLFLPIVMVYINEVHIFDFQRYLNSIFFSSSEGIVVYDSQGKVERCNPQFLELLGLAAVEELHEHYQVLEKMLQIETSRQMHTLNYCVITPAGKRLEILLTPVRDDKGMLERFVCLVEDVTYEVLWEEKSIRHEKVGLVGQLAAGFAHEIKNPLTSMKGFFQLLKSSIKERDLPGEPTYIENILAEIEKVNLMVSEFLGLAKPRGSKLAFADVGYILDEIKPWIESEALLHNVAVQYLIEPDLPLLVMDVEEIKQALLHVISNAYKAMPNGGILIIRVDKLNTGRLVIHIQDTGHGIAQEVLPRVFEPFYSTSGNRVGLGLTVTKDIIEKHQGSICIDSSLGVGTMVTLELPYQR